MSVRCLHVVKQGTRQQAHLLGKQQVRRHSPPFWGGGGTSGSDMPARGGGLQGLTYLPWQLPLLAATAPVGKGTKVQG